MHSAATATREKAMKRKIKNIRFLIEYFIVIIPYHLLRALPRPLMRGFARTISFCGYTCWPGVGKLIRANLKAAFPEKGDKEISEIAYKSFFNTIYNIVDFLWMMGKQDRIEKYMHLPPDILRQLRDCVESGTRILFVNPHLGSWEGSGLMAANQAGIRLAAIAKITRNPYLNKLINQDNRERGGIKIIFSQGAMKEALRCLNEGMSMGTLIDQNTRVRNGGIFVNMFGIPVASSRAPATLWHYCLTNNIPAKVIYGTSVRENDILVAHSATLSKEYHEYANDEEIIQELMDISERFIRRYPDQYLWLYKRFQYIPPDSSDEVKAKYPYYAVVPPPTFFRKLIAKADEE